MFEDLIRYYLPRLFVHLTNVGVINMLSLSWFITLYISAMPFQSAVHIMDCFFYDGPRVGFSLFTTEGLNRWWPFIHSSFLSPFYSMQVLLTVGLQILSICEQELLAQPEDCYVMSYLTTFLHGISNTDTGTAFKGEKASINVNSLVRDAYRRFGDFDNKSLVRKRQDVRLRVVQQLQDNVSRSAVRTATDESLLSKDQLVELHREFHDGCMKVSDFGLWLLQRNLYTGVIWFTYLFPLFLELGGILVQRAPSQAACAESRAVPVHSQAHYALG